MKKLLVVTSSVRDGRNADRILELVNNRFKYFPDFEVTVADFKTMPLPLLDSAILPSADDFAPEDKNVAKWSNLVKNSDAVLILVAEYNHSFTAVIKNAIDWLYKEWHDKPIGLVGYGWVGAARATKHLRDVLGSTIGAKTIETEANLRFTKEIDRDGLPLSNAANEAIDAVLSELKNTVTSRKSIAYSAR